MSDAGGCANTKCPVHDDSESGCSRFPINTVDLCESFVRPDMAVGLKKEISILKQQVEDLALANLNLAKTCQELMDENKRLKGHPYGDEK